MNLKTNKMLSFILSATLFLSMTQTGTYMNKVDASAADQTAKYELASGLEDGEEYLMLFNTASGSESDVAKFYTNTGTLGALQANGDSVAVKQFGDASLVTFSEDRQSLDIAGELLSDTLWTCEKMSDGSYAFSNNGAYLTDNGEAPGLAEVTPGEKQSWTFAEATGENNAYTPLKSVTSSTVLRISASSMSFKLASLSTATNSRNSNVYLYTFSDGAVEDKPTAAPKPTATPEPTFEPIEKDSHGDGIVNPLSSILTVSDYQKWYPNNSYNRDDLEYLHTQLIDIVKGTRNAGVNPNYLLFGGDTTCLNSANDAEIGQSQMLEVITGAWPQLTGENNILIQGNHDPADTEGLAQTGPYEFDDFIIYVLNEDDFPTKQGDESVLNDYILKASYDLEDWLIEKAESKDYRPIIIASHTGLHYDIDRKDGNNQYAYVIFDVVNEYAKELDIIFMFGHNHTNGDEQVGGSITFYPAGSELEVCKEDSIDNQSGTPTEINFTYMNYGYIGYIGDINNNESEFIPTNKLTMGLTEIFNDSIVITKYSKDGYEPDFENVIERKNVAPEKAPEVTTAPEQGATPAPTAVPTVTPAPDDGGYADVAALAKVKKLTIKKKGASKVVLTWKKVKGADGYVINYSKDKKLKKKVFIKKTKKTKLVLKKIKAKKVYYSVAAYKKNGKKLVTGKAVKKAF